MGGCASKPLPKFQKPIARAQVQRVRTTAYTHTEADHIKYGRKNALGTRLESEGVRSAAADWSRWPAGTLFRIRETGELYRVDDYGWALSGTNTIDLYKPSRAEMNAWGVRHVTIENLEWGNPRRSLSILKGRSKYRHVKRMVTEYRSQGMKFPALTPMDPPAGSIASQSGTRSIALTPFR
jgi:3D (Asp-Asp-Asp) domain-containing protein